LNYKETLLFVGKCLTISFEDKNKKLIRKKLQSRTIDWNTVVKVSTAHYVFPALYCNFKRAEFLKYLPVDLVEYMKYITDLNRDRNLQIIQQAKEINSLLLANNITPIFLKGTGNLLAGLYDDIAERMIGDIDFVISGKDYLKSIIVMKEFGYFKRVPFELLTRHYPRLVKKGCIAAIEIHKDLLLQKYKSEFNYSFVEKDIQFVNGTAILSYANKLNLSIISNQINDHGFYYKNLALRNAYDVFLLSKKTNAEKAVYTLNKLSNPLNCFLASCNEVFNNVDSLKFNKNKKTVLYLRNFNSQFINPIPRKDNERFNIYVFIRIRLIIIIKSLIYKEYRVWLLNLLTDKDWYKRKLIQFRMRKH
jgi:hypothetical protein